MVRASGSRFEEAGNGSRAVNARPCDSGTGNGGFVPRFLPPPQIQRDCCGLRRADGCASAKRSNGIPPYGALLGSYGSLGSGMSTTPLARKSGDDCKPYGSGVGGTYNNAYSRGKTHGSNFGSNFSDNYCNAYGSSCLNAHGNAPSTPMGANCANMGILSPPTACHRADVDFLRSTRSVEKDSRGRHQSNHRRDGERRNRGGDDSSSIERFSDYDNDEARDFLEEGGGRRRPGSSDGASGCNMDNGRPSFRVEDTGGGSRRGRAARRRRRGARGPAARDEEVSSCWYHTACGVQNHCQRVTWDISYLTLFGRKLGFQALYVVYTFRCASFY